MLIDLACLTEHNRREREELDKSQDAESFRAEHPGAEPFPDQETRWAKAIAATKGENNS